MAGVDVIPLVLDKLPLDIRSDTDFLRGVSWDEKEENPDIKYRIHFDTSQSRGETFDVLSTYFYEEGGNVLTQENLEKIKQIETNLWDNDVYQTKFCLRGIGGCQKPKSILRYFDGTVDPLLNDPTFSDIIGIVNLANTLNKTKGELQDYLGKNSVVNSNEVSSDITRSGIYIGWPLDGFESKTDRETKQEEKVQDFVIDEWNSDLEDIYNDKVGNMDFYYTSVFLLQAVITKQVIYDQALALGSFIFIFFFMWFQTRSLWVTGFSMVSVITGFAINSLIYRFCFDFRYFGIFHVLAVFIILGIGADNIFVFFDTWKETGFHEYKSLAHRLSGAYRKAAMAMLFTSTTTAVAVIVSATSPFLGISSFGVFSGFLIVVNYMTVLIFIPTGKLYNRLFHRY